LDGAEEYHYTMVMNNQGKAILSLAGVKYENEHSWFWGLWTTKTKIDVKRYIVDYDGKTYYIGFAQYGKGYANAWKAEDFENTYLKKLGDATTFENEYADENHSQAASDYATVLNTQNTSAEHSIPMAGGEEELPIQSPRKAGTSISTLSSKFGGKTIIIDENLSPVVATKLSKQGYNIKTFEKGTTDADILN
jgi:hypothetical protein